MNQNSPESKKPVIQRRSRSYRPLEKSEVPENQAEASSVEVTDSGLKDSPSEKSGLEQIDAAVAEKGDWKVREEARKIIRKYMLIALGIGLIPVPLADMAALTLLQTRMIRELCKVFGYDFEGVRIKSLISGLVGSFGGVPLGNVLAFSMLKMVPGVGTILGAGSLSITSGAVTYGVGRVFYLHFTNGGDLLNFNPKRYNQTFLKETQRGKTIAKSGVSEN